MKSPLTLYIGNKNYSSWSLCAWLVLQKAELPFEEKLINLAEPDYKSHLSDLSDAATVPVLHVKDKIIADSLAICEWAALAVPNLWPKDEQKREAAKALTRRIHQGFKSLSADAPMNLRRRTQNKMPQACLDDAAKLAALWEEALGAHNGAFLFDDWSIADAFSTAAASRFISYDMARSARVDTYISELMLDEDFMDWEADAMIEPYAPEDYDSLYLPK